MVDRRCRADDWMPGLFHGERTMREVLATLPAITASEVPWIVRFFENPCSRWSLPGAISLFRHDCVHVLLGRGLTSEDEAFVLGFTMGQSDGTSNLTTRLLQLFLPRRFVRDVQIAIFRFVARRLYPLGFRLTDSDLRAYDIGLGLGEMMPVRTIEDFPFEYNLDRTVADLRAELGINVPRMESINRLEQMLIPGFVSARLDTDPGVDHAHLTD